MPVAKSETPEAPETPAEATTTNAPAGPYAWDALARLAAARSDEARALLLDAQAERHKAAVETGWKSPRLKAGHYWGDQDSSTPGRSGMRTYADEEGAPTRPFNRYREWSDRDSRGSSIGLRVYFANPFVNRWLRRRGEAAAQALEMEAGAEAYAVYCEVRALCLEADMLREDTELLAQTLELRAARRDLRRDQMSAGVTTPAGMIRAETRLATLRSEIGAREIKRQHLLRQIALLAGVPPADLELAPREGEAVVADERLNVDALTAIAMARRPDLARLEREEEAAGHALKAARAAQMPWFEYAEGAFDKNRSETDSFQTHYTGHDDTTRKEDEWQLRAAFALPVFNWLGDEVKLTRVRLQAARERVTGQHLKVREEVAAVLADYRAASAAWRRLRAESKTLYNDMTVRLDSLEKLPAVKPEEVLEAREELLNYRRVCLKVEHECHFTRQLLETVSGGALE